MTPHDHIGAATLARLQMRQRTRTVSVSPIGARAHDACAYAMPVTTVPRRLPSLRAPSDGEMPLSPAEVEHARRIGVIQ